MRTIRRRARDALRAAFPRAERREDEAADPPNRFATAFRPGHYYSPLPDPGEIAFRADRLFGPPPAELPGIDLRVAEQLALVEELAPFHEQLPFAAHPQPGLRYGYDNDWYSLADGVFLYALLRKLRPRHVVEVGSGWSSALMLDTDERFLGSSTTFTFVEPYPERLISLLRDDERDRVDLRVAPVQDVDVSVFARLEPGDILFVDSSHVSKIGSDVNHLVFNVLPMLQPGVYVHFHDIFYPFEYPQHWIDEGRAWNEAYMIRAFLQGNASFEIALMNTYLRTFHRDVLARFLPAALRQGGGSLWLRRAASPR